VVKHVKEDEIEKGYKRLLKEEGFKGKNKKKEGEKERVPGKNRQDGKERSVG
jgi:hypothetical protein